MPIKIKALPIQPGPVMGVVHQALEKKNMQAVQVALALMSISEWVAVYTQYIINQVWFGNEQAREKFFEFMHNVSCNALLKKAAPCRAAAQEKQKILRRHHFTLSGLAAEGTMVWRSQTEKRDKLKSDIKEIEADLQLLWDNAIGCIGLIPLIFKILEEKIEKFESKKLKEEMIARPQAVLLRFIKMIQCIQALNESQADTEQDSFAKLFTLIEQVLTECGVDSGTVRDIQFKDKDEQVETCDIPQLIGMIHQELKTRQVIEMPKPLVATEDAECALSSRLSMSSSTHAAGSCLKPSAPFLPLVHKPAASIASFPSVSDLSASDLSEKAQPLLVQFQTVVITTRPTHRRARSDGLQFLGAPKTSPRDVAFDSTASPERTVSAPVPTLTV